MLRKNLSRALFCGFFIVQSLTAGSALAGDASARLSGRELHKIFPGSFRAFALGLVKVTVIANADGGLSVRLKDGLDSGNWSIRSGQLCISLMQALKGDTHCSDVVYRDGWYHTSMVVFQKTDDSTIANR